MTETLALALFVVLLPGAVSLMWVKLIGVVPDLVIFGTMARWVVLSRVGAADPGNPEIAPGITGDEAMTYRQRVDIPKAHWSGLVRVPGTLCSAIAMLVGRAVFRRRLQLDAPS